MKKSRIFVAIFSAFCLILTTLFSALTVDIASAKEITKASQAKKLAKKLLKGGTIIDVERDDDDGLLVYEIEIMKGKKQYTLVFRASDSKLISYSWDMLSGYVKKGKGRIISKKKCKKLAKKKVSGGKINSVTRKRSNGIDYYKVKMRKGGKKYEMEINARTGKLLEYGWELVAKKPSVNEKDKPNSSQPETTPQPQHQEWPTISSKISMEEAKSIALTDAGLSESEVVFITAERKFTCIIWYNIAFYSSTHKYKYVLSSEGDIYGKEIEELDIVLDNIFK